FADDVVPPRDIRMHRFADDVRRSCEAEFERSGRAKRSLRIVGRHRDAVSLRQGGDPTSLDQTAAVGDVRLDNAAGALLQKLAKSMNADEPLSCSDGSADC